MLRRIGFAAAISVGSGVEASAAPSVLALSPANTSIALTVYALGLFPVPGDYRRFHGTLELDPDHPDACRVSVTVDQASLHMDDPARARRALAPDMLDAAHFPTMGFAGTCAGPVAAGQLSLHGVSRPFSLKVTRDGMTIAGAGHIMRRDYAIDGLPHLLGQAIKIRFTTTLPAR